MISENTGENAPEGAVGLAGVGARLASTRKKKQVDLHAIAGELHLRVEVLRALEAGDEAGLPSPAFTRGYVRSYARLLGMDVDELLAQLPQSDEYHVTPVGRAMGPRHSARPQLGKLLLWLLALAGLAGAVLYGVPLVERLLNAQEVEADLGQLALPLAERDPAPVEGVEPIPQQVVVPTRVETPADVVPDETESVSVLAADSDKTAAVAGVSGEEDIPEPEPEVPVSKSELLLKFHEDSWVEVDVDGRRLLAGVERAGSERRLEAEPPIHVLLGNAPGVEVIYNGEAVDTAPNRKGKVARIILEKN